MSYFPKHTILAFFALVLLLHGIALPNETSINPDSVKRLVANATKEQKVDVLISSAEEIMLKYPSESIELAQNALFLATESNDSTSVAKSQLLLAKAYSIIGNYALAVDYLEQSQTIFNTLTDTLNLVETHQVYGQIYTRIGEFKKALDNTEIAFTLAGKLKLRDKIAELTRETGNIYFYFNEKTIALDF